MSGCSFLVCSGTKVAKKISSSYLILCISIAIPTFFSPVELHIIPDFSTFYYKNNQNKKGEKNILVVKQLKLK